MFIDCTNAEGPLYQWVFEAIKEKIRIQELTFGEKLPSKRRLAADIGVSINTIQQAYDQLLAEGFIRSEVRRGYFVCDVQPFQTMTAQEPLTTSLESPPYDLDFSPSGIDCEHFPLYTWRKITKEVCDESFRDELLTPDAQGLDGLRESIVRYLKQSRNIETSKDRIVISSGTEYLFLTLFHILGPERVYGMEDPGYETLRDLFHLNRIRFHPLPVDEMGLQTASLPQQSMDVICSTPSHQFPTGVILPMERRLELLEWANRPSDRYLIEDDFDSEFKYSGRPIPPIKSYDHADRVIYLGSFSKSISPTLRISFMVLPKPLIEIYRQLSPFSTCPVSNLNQMILMKFLNDGHYERHINRMRKLYKRKRDLLIDTIRKRDPEWPIKGADAGLYILLELSSSTCSKTLIAYLRNRSMNIRSVDQYRQEPHSGRSMLIVGFSKTPLDRIEDAANALVDAIHDYDLASSNFISPERIH